MSYRAFKRLLGETSLERKCRFLFGAFILLLISASFWLYAHQTEDLAYDQITTTCRLLVQPTLARLHVGADQPEAHTRQKAMDEFQNHWKELWPEGLPSYSYRILKPGEATEDALLMREFQANDQKLEVSNLLPAQRSNEYYAAVRATHSCLACHRQQAAEEDADGSRRDVK